MKPFGYLVTLTVLSLVRDFGFCGSFADTFNKTHGDDNQESTTSPLTKSLRQKRKYRSGCCKQLDFKCTPRNEGQLRYISGSIQVCKSRVWTTFESIRPVPKKGKLPLSCLDAKFKGLDKGKGDGAYWINPTGFDDLRNAFLAYCDMTTAGGGWLLVAKVTHDFAWICPELKGLSCGKSGVDPLRANLFHPVHTRDFVDLSVTEDENSGIHLKKSLIRKTFQSGLQSLRFTFVTANTGWKASEDAYAAFNRQRPNAMFLDGQWVEYTTEKQDYTWNVIKHARKSLKFSGSTLCWGSNVDVSYRFYDHGLHAGSASAGNKRCHLANDETEIMLKSHYAVVDGTGRNARWDRAQFGFLKSRFLQAPCKRIALWVR